MQAIGPQYVQDYIARFGFDPKMHPPVSSRWRWCAGSGHAAPDGRGLRGLRQRRVPGGPLSDRARHRFEVGNVLSEAKPVVAGESAERAIDPRNAFLMTTLLRDVDRLRHRDPRPGARPQGFSRARRAPPTKTSTRGSARLRRIASSASAWIGYDQPKVDARRENRDLEAASRHCRSGSPSCSARAQRRAGEARSRLPDGVIFGAHQSGFGPARRFEQHDGLFLRGVPASAGRAGFAGARHAGCATSPDVRDQLFLGWAFPRCPALPSAPSLKGRAASS